uniref:Methyltransferase n=1 Tax=Ignavibacterium album TaxID=591197 RepID=A0A7V2ZHW4_9BACT
MLKKSKVKYLVPDENNALKLIKDRGTKYYKEIIRDKNIYLFQGDVLKGSLFRKEFSDLIITSPPYNVDIKYNSHRDNLSYDDYLEFSEKWIYNCYQWSKPQGRFALNCPLDKNKGGQQSVGADLTTIAKKVGWKYHSTIIWNEGNISRRTAWGSWLSASAPFVIAPVELVIIFYKDQWKKTIGSKVSDISRDEFIEWTNGLWSFSGESRKRIGHPAPFPKELPRRLIKLFSFVGDVIFDPFVGSGTTIVEAVNNNRIGVGLEIDPNYCEIAKSRIKKETIVFNPKLDLQEPIYA